MTASRPTTPLCENDQRPRAKGAAAVSSTGIPTVADRTAARIAFECTIGAKDFSEPSFQIGMIRRYRAGSGRISLSYQAIPKPSALISPWSWYRGS